MRVNVQAGSLWAGSLLPAVALALTMSLVACTAAATPTPEPATPSPTPELLPTVSPSAEPSPQPEPSAEMTIYVVRKGDTLIAIARAYGITLAALRAANPEVSDPRKLQIGQKLRIPAP